MTIRVLAAGAALVTVLAGCATSITGHGSGSAPAVQPVQLPEYVVGDAADVRAAPDVSRRRRRPRRHPRFGSPGNS